MSEGTLVDACIRGDAPAWERFVDEYGPALREAVRFTLRRAGGGAEAGEVEHVVQAVFVSLCADGARRLRSFRGESSLKTWLTTVACRATLNYLERERPDAMAGPLVLEPGARIDRDPLALAEERARLHEALRRLPSRDRLLLQYFYFDGLSYKAIAEALRLPAALVPSLLHRAREALRRRLPSEEETAVGEGRL